MKKQVERELIIGDAVEIKISKKKRIVEYVKKDLGLFKGTISDFYVYEKVGDKEVKIPKSRIVRSFDYSKECNK